MQIFNNYANKINRKKEADFPLKSTKNRIKQDKISYLYKQNSQLSIYAVRVFHTTV